MEAVFHHDVISVISMALCRALAKDDTEVDEEVVLLDAVLFVTCNVINNCNRKGSVTSARVK